MPQTIEIQNNLVTLTERSVLGQIPLDEWLDKLEKRNPLWTPVLPVGTRAVYWDNVDLTNQKLIVLIEQQPQIIRMNFLGEVKELSIPYTRFFFYCTTADPTNNIAWHLSDYRVFWAKSQYNDPDKPDMIQALLPNVYGDGRICFGSTGANADQNLAERLNQTVNEFYVSEFNRDLTIFRPNGWRSYARWERMTQRDPTGWMKWDDWTDTTRRFYSFNQLATYGDPAIARFEPMVAAEPIPDVPLGATFGRITEWLDRFDNGQRDRMLQAMLRDRALNNERYETPMEVEEFEDADAEQRAEDNAVEEAVAF